MSYSYVKKNGFPDFGNYQLAYNIVREADLLDAFDFDRCMIYAMNKKNEDLENAFTNSKALFETRILKHYDDNLYFTEYSKKQHDLLTIQALNRIDIWQNLLKN